jgi:signal transduction histidine kinase
MWFLRVFSSAIFLFSIVFSIPLAFDVGGRKCGLAYSLSLSTFYFLLSILRISTPEWSRFRSGLVKTLGVLQWLLFPALLIWSLNRFSVDANAQTGGWVARTFDGKRAANKNLIFGSDGLVETATVESWGKVLRWSTPVFQLCEGFCSLLVIQATGQISRWLVNRTKSDTWIVGYLFKCSEMTHG